jgi:hypothetical protein
MSIRRRILNLIRNAIGAGDVRPAEVTRLEAARRELRRPLAPRPYARTTRDGEVIDELTNYALYRTERILGYALGSLDVIQGSYKAPGDGASASAGTHDGGGAVDLSAANWPAKVRALRAVGFAAWHRPAIPNLWGEHIHAVLIGNDRLSPAAAAQVASYRRHRNGLADDGPDPTWHPSPVPTFRMPAYRIEPRP